MSSCLLIGAGGHARVVYEAAMNKGIVFDGFIDPKIESFFHLSKVDSNKVDDRFFIGIGNANMNGLSHRHSIYLELKNSGGSSFPVISMRSFVSEYAKVGNGTFVSHNVIVQANAKIGENCIINSGAIIEHDVVIGDGCHIAPGAIVLGGAVVGAGSMVGAGAVILPMAEVLPAFLVPSLTRYKSND